MIVTLFPNACKNPPHSKAIYEAPTINIFPGGFFNQKTSSEDIACYFPGIYGSEGLPPVAINIYLAVTISTTPSVPFN